MRYAADRAGVSHSTWSRIERGLMSVDNRFLLADIAAALECSVAELTGQPFVPADRDVQAAQEGVFGVRQALVEVDLDERSDRSHRTLAEVERDIELIRSFSPKSDFAAVHRLMPTVLYDLHALAFGPDRDAALRHLVWAGFVLTGTTKMVGYPAEAWIAAERCRQAAVLLDDPVLTGFAAFNSAAATMFSAGYAAANRIAETAAAKLDGRTGQPGALEMLGMLHLQSAFTARALGRTGDSADRLAEAAQLADRTGETTTNDLWFGPTNVNFWRVSIETDGGDPGFAVEIAREVNPSTVPSVGRQVAFYTDTARALARTRRDRDAVRYLLTAERIAPVRVRSSRLVAETARGLLDRAERRAGGSELRGLVERMGLVEV